VESLTFTVVDSGSAEARWAISQYFDELARRFAEGFIVGNALDDAAADFNEPTGVFILAVHSGQIAGCGAVTFLDPTTAEIKRMWVSPKSRGLGVGRRLLQRLEDEARSAGCTTIVLDTNAALTEAIAMYESAGYRRTDTYNENPYADYWFTKSVTQT
jgi:GNAT superfamily N-acetyltransferase